MSTALDSSRLGRIEIVVWLGGGALYVIGLLQLIAGLDALALIVFSDYTSPWLDALLTLIEAALVFALSAALMSMFRKRGIHLAGWVGVGFMLSLLWFVAIQSAVGGNSHASMLLAGSLSVGIGLAAIFDRLASRNESA